MLHQVLGEAGWQAGLGVISGGGVVPSLGGVGDACGAGLGVRSGVTCGACLGVRSGGQEAGLGVSSGVVMSDLGARSASSSPPAPLLA